ncbi:MAG TPA: cupredoxin domain-containing protein [Longimicrobiales bacterium]
MKRMDVGRWIPAIAIAVVALACSDDDGTGPTDGNAPAAITIEMRNLSFQPQVDTVAVGGTVTWRNEDSEEHNTIADDGEWASENIGVDGTFQHTFDAAGSYDYHCSLHENMTGTIVVR